LPRRRQIIPAAGKAGKMDTRETIEKLKSLKIEVKEIKGKYQIIDKRDNFIFPCLVSENNLIKVYDDYARGLIRSLRTV
jgi:hypothetical protein